MYSDATLEKVNSLIQQHQSNISKWAQEPHYNVKIVEAQNELVKLFSRQRALTLNSTIKRAWDALTHAVNNDPEYAWGVHCNIAMPIYDSMTNIDHESANKAAAKVMEHLFKVDMTKHPHYFDFNFDNTPTL